MLVVTSLLPARCRTLRVPFISFPVSFIFVLLLAYAIVVTLYGKSVFNSLYWLLVNSMPGRDRHWTQFTPSWSVAPDADLLTLNSFHSNDYQLCISTNIRKVDP